MSKTKSLGEFEIMVLAALLRLGDDAYGVSILNEIETRSGRAVSIGGLYPTLARLEKKGLVSSEMGEGTPVRGGRAKRYYQITGEGAARLERSLQVMSSMLAGLPGWSGRGTI